VHGFCGCWGVIAVAFFAKNKGILYGAAGSGKLLGAQCVGCIAIIAWVGILSGLFFYISDRKKYLRLSEGSEIIGGDIHYFGPLEFCGNIYQYDLEEGIQKKLNDQSRPSNLLNVNI